MGKWIKDTPFIGDKELQMHCQKQFQKLKAEEAFLFQDLKSKLSNEDHALLEKYTKTLYSLAEMHADVAYTLGGFDAYKKLH